MAEGSLSNQSEVLRGEYEALRLNSPAARPATDAASLPADGPDEPLSALCISGGGIRSATFGLGALQGLAESGLLPRFDYLSTVSGGGYIGSWLTAWATRGGGIGAVAARLLPEEADRPAADGGPDPIRHLREYNSYLTPRFGSFTADTWTLVAAVARNIVLNWCVLVPLLLAVLMVPRLYVSILALPERLDPQIVATDAEPNYGDPAFDVLSGSPLVAYVLPLSCMALLAVALFSTLRFLPSVGGREHDRVTYTKLVLLPLILAVLAFLVFDSLHYLGSYYVEQSSVARVVGAAFVACGAAWAIFLVAHGRRFGDRLRRIVGPMSLAIAAMALGAGFASWVITNKVLWNPDPEHALSWEQYATVGPPFVLLGYCLATVLFVGLSSRSLHDEDREWMSRAVAGPLVACVAWIGLCAVVLLLPEVALDWGRWGNTVAVGVTGSSAWLTSISEWWRKSREGEAKQSSGDGAIGMVLAAAPLVFIVLFSVGLSIVVDVLLAHLQGLNWRDHDAILRRTPFGLLVGGSMILVALSWLMARYVNINTFSLHGIYRDRLVRAYLGASNRGRHANPFTGFDRHDDLSVSELAGTRPFHVLNLTLNLVKPDHLAWQERKAASFVVTPLHAGSSDLGYRPSGEYAGGISLGTAVAISGAAASPNMGYRSTALGGFIMTLFNARQGVWLGNTGPAGEKTWRESSPHSAVRLILKEALGLTSDRSEYVYLSDGGHFENLALYEMVRRRCRCLVVLDSGCDPELTFEDLGNALRKIRIDFGISIEFDEGHFAALRERRRRSAVATIRYSDVDAGAADGRLLYVKPMLLGDEPPDVRSYASSHETFPHQSTADQWFSESQTESYRQLGLHTIREVSRGWSGGSPADLFDHLAGAKQPSARG
jgi:hypothetical protein